MTQLDAHGAVSAPWSQRLRRKVPVEAAAAALLFVVLWFIVSRRTPDYILPPLTVVIERVVGILTTPEYLRHVFMSLARIGGGLVGSFLMGTIIGLAMGYSRRTDRFVMPILQTAQGIPSLSWVVIAIIWFQSVELRIFFIIVMVTLPGFAFQTQDSYRAIPKELRDMAKSLRPRRGDMFRTVTLPGIIPDLLTAWKVNLGLGTRVVLIAELVGASIGVGYQLLAMQQLFSMAGVIAWTGVLVLFVLLIQHVISRIERRLLRYRPAAVTDDGDQPATDNNNGRRRRRIGQSA